MDSRRAAELESEVMEVAVPVKIASERSTLRVAALLLAFSVLLAVVHTWPLATAPHRLSRNDNGDTLLNTWAIAWVAHQLPRDPLHLFDANIFWPERRTLGYSEAMVVQGVMAAPILALGGSPVLAFNLVQLLGFVLTGTAFGLLVHRWTGSLSAALVAASAAAFNSHVLVRMPHLQTQHPEFVALALFGLDQVYARQRVRDACVLALGFALQGLSSLYIMTFTTWAMIFAAASRFWGTPRATRWRVVGLLSLAGVFAAVMLAPYLWQYYRIHVEQGFARGVELARAAHWQDYLTTGSRLYFDWLSARFWGVSASANFPGLTVFVLAGAALVSGSTRKDVRVRMCGVVVLGCLLVSAVPWLPGYASILRVVPLFWAVRVQAHIGQIVLLMLAVLAGYGVARIQHAWGARRGWPVVAACLVVAVNGESLRAPLVYTPFDGIAPIYDVLRDEPRAVVVEIPMEETRHIFANGPYMLNSTRHWKPMINGYSGFYPMSYVRVAIALRTFPDYDALAVLHAQSVTHVVVHRSPFVGRRGLAAFEAIRSVAALQLLANDGKIYIFRLR
jgi:hypothetical protein